MVVGSKQLGVCTCALVFSWAGRPLILLSLIPHDENPYYYLMAGGAFQTVPRLCEVHVCILRRIESR